MLELADDGEGESSVQGREVNQVCLFVLGSCGGRLLCICFVNKSSCAAEEDCSSPVWCVESVSTCMRQCIVWYVWYVWLCVLRVRCFFFSF